MVMTRVSHILGCLLLTPSLLCAEVAGLELVTTSAHPGIDKYMPNKPNGLIFRSRQYIPSVFPESISRQVNGLKLELVEPVKMLSGKHWLALYRTSYGAKQQRFVIHYLDAKGNVLNSTREWRDREVHDMRYDAETQRLIYNVGVAGSAAGLKNAAMLVAWDPTGKRGGWQSESLVSNDIFIIHENVVIAGYGFSKESDFLYLINKRTGEVMADYLIPTAHDHLLVKDGLLEVITYKRTRVYRFVP